jgi:glycosyltransferase involved in cell wall biosynthesis
MESVMPKVSFIVTIYNMEKYLHRCLYSICRQSDSDFEVILVDDGSTDSSAIICDEFTKSDPRFTYHYQKNTWLSAARNMGMSKARGEYISFIDADDYIDADYIKALYPYAKQTEADIVCFGFKWNMHGNEAVITECPEKKVVEISDGILLKHFCQDWLLPQRMNFAWSKIYNRRFLDTIGVLFNVNALYCEDRNFNYKLLFQSKRTVYTTSSPYFYFQHDKSITHKAALSDNIFTRYMSSFQDVCDYWKSKQMTILDPVKPIMLLRIIQGAMYNTMQTVNNLEIMADSAQRAFEEHPIFQLLDTNTLKISIEIYSSICGLSWAEQSKIWLFALSLLGGKEGIMTWQKLYPQYSGLVNNI